MSLVLPARLRSELEAHGRAALPREAVGFLFGRRAGDDRTAERFAPLANLAASPTAFALDAAEVATALSAEPDRPLALFHTHPTDLAAPSTADLAGQNDWPDLWHLILSFAGPVRLRCWRIFFGQVLPEPVRFERDPAAEGATNESDTTKKVI